jgi:WD40 repeat protein
MVRIWDRDTGRLLRAQYIGGEHIAYSADGERIVVGDSEGSITVIDADTLEPVAPSFRLDHGVLGLFAGPDGRTAVALTDEPGITVVDIVDRRVLHEHAIERDPISAAFSPDGERVAVGTGTGEVGVFDVATGDWVRPPAVGHRDTVITVAYAPDGNTLVSGGLDGRVTLWDGHTGAALGTIVARHDVATGAGFDPDGHTVIIASADGTVARWDTDALQWIATSCRIAGRSLTPTEWADILADRPYVDPCQ